jgi:phenylacetate-CoA ligase
MRSLEDVLYPLLRTYESLPLGLRNVIGYLYRRVPVSIKYGDFYKKYNYRIKKFENIDCKEVVFHTSEELLINHVNYSLKNVPFYENFRQILSIEEFKKLPIISKDLIMSNPTKFINKNFINKTLNRNTGGSNGKPFSFLIEKGITRPKEIAHFNWYWGKYGYKPGDKILMIRGKSLRNNKNFEFQTLGNKLVISCYNLNQKSIKEIYLKIKDFQPKYIHAYPSSLLIFTKVLKRFLKEEVFELKIKGIFLGSEQLYDYDRKYIESFFHSNIITWYGHSECLIHGSKCEISGDFHFYPFYGFMEIVDKDNNPITSPGIEGKIIATGLDNKAMPLIRYDTGDIGVLSPYLECGCGFRGTSLSKIIGRGKDFIILRDNTKVTLTAFIFGQHHKEFDLIKEMQIIQNKKGEITLNIVPLGNFTRNNMEKIKERLENSVVKNSLTINIQIVKNIEKTHRGKHKILIQNL